MSKAQETRENLIRKAAPIFNRQGFLGTSISDIMKATGLKKGGIYNHFKNKDELAIAAFDFYIKLIQEHYGEVLKGTQIEYKVPMEITVFQSSGTKNLMLVQTLLTEEKNLIAAGFDLVESSFKPLPPLS